MTPMFSFTMNSRAFPAPLSCWCPNWSHAAFDDVMYEPSASCIPSDTATITLLVTAHHSFDSWDEQIHYNIAYTDSWVWNYMEYSDAVMSNVEMRVPTGDTLEEEQWIGEWLNQANDTVVLSSQKVDFSDMDKGLIFHRY